MKYSNDKISITGSLALSPFEKQNILEKLEGVLKILTDIGSATFYFTEHKHSIKVVVKSVITIRGMRKVMRFHCIGTDKQEVASTCLIRLSNKYFKLINKNRIYNKQAKLGYVC